MGKQTIPTVSGLKIEETKIILPQRRLPDGMAVLI